MGHRRCRHVQQLPTDRRCHQDGTLARATARITYQQLDGQTDNTTALSPILGGLDPIATVGDVTDSITTDTVAGHATWRIVQHPPTGTDANRVPTSTWTIDSATGLVVGLEQDWTYGQDSHAHRSVTLSNIHTGVQLPAAYPGAFPAGRDRGP